MARFAAYDEFSIYAVADTAEAAIDKARQDANEPAAEFQTARISDDLAAEIERDGWNGNTRAFDVVRGEIIATDGEAGE